MPSLTSIAEEILAQAKQIDAHLEANSLPAPSFSHDSLDALPPALQTVRGSLANSATDFRTLVRGPVGAAMDISFSWTDLAALRFVYHFGLARHVPAEGSASYAELAAASGVLEPLLFRFVRVAISCHVFDEDAGGRVVHTAASRLLATSGGFADAVGLETEELAPAAARMLDAWQRWGQEGAEPAHTGFALANNTDLAPFSFLAEHPDRARRFGGAMHFFTADGTWHLRHLLAAFDWAGLDRDGARVVDVGGGNGQVSQFLARHTERLRFTVQDLPHVVPAATEALPEDLKSRVSFEVHSFLEPQGPDAAPDAFLLRWILHDWPDAYCARILQGLVPALRAGSKVLIYEYVLAEEPARSISDRFGLQLDLIMATFLNGKERSARQFKDLLAAADPRFVLDAVRRPEGSTMSLVEVSWRP